MELTIEHLAPYLPYELKMHDSYNNRIETLSSLHTKADECITLFYKNVGHSRRINEVKPILRPLSDLRKKIEVNGKMLIAANHIKNVNYGFAGEYPPNTQQLEDRLNRGDISYNDIMFLIAHHFDVFRLIEKNLAIDINTL